MKEVNFQSQITFNGEEEVPVDVHAEFSYDSGEFIEGGHPFNGYGASFEFNSISVDFNGRDITEFLSDEDYKRLIKEAKNEL